MCVCEAMRGKRGRGGGHPVLHVVYSCCTTTPQTPRRSLRSEVVPPCLAFPPARCPQLLTTCLVVCLYLLLETVIHSEEVCESEVTSG